MAAPKIRLVLGDDQVLFVESLRYVLEAEAPDMEIVAVAHTGEEVIAAVDALEPDLVVLDVRMPELDGVRTAERLHARHPQVYIIMLTSFDNDEYVQKAILNGASGYLLKDLPPKELVDAIRAVSRGTVFFSPSVARKIVARIENNGPPQESGELPDWARLLGSRDRQILTLISRGLSNKEIAAELFLSEQTIKNYVSVIYAKIGARNRSQAATIARDI